MSKINNNDIEIIAKLWGLDTSNTLIIDPSESITVVSNRIHSKVIEGYTLIASASAKVDLSLRNVPIIQFGSFKHQKDKDQSFYIIKNKNKTIRWMIPIEAKSPFFLNFYNVPTLLSTVYKIVFRAIYLTKLQSVFFDTVTVSCDSTLKKYIPDTLSYDALTLFTGTVGENRKVILCLLRNRKPTNFIKIAITSSSAKNIKNEISILMLLSSQKFYSFEHPQITKSVQDNTIVLSAIKPDKIIKISVLGSMHVKFFHELAEKYLKIIKIGDLKIYKEIFEHIEFLKNGNFCDNGLDRNIVLNSISIIEHLVSKMDPDMSVSTSISHGDFTPWNMFAGENKLYVYDWELAQEDIPVLFDYFHYIYQTNILSGDNNIETIWRVLAESCSTRDMSELIKEFYIDINLVHALYLCHTVSYYLKLYTRQVPLHEQAHWLVKTWNLALVRLNR